MHQCLDAAAQQLEPDLARIIQLHGPTLAKALARMGEGGPPPERPAPHLAAEITPPGTEVWRPFERWWEEARSDPAALAAALQQVGVPGALQLLGQRITPASLTDARAIPPTRGELLAAADAVHADGLTVAGRAWTKHAGRSAEAWWGIPTGGVAEKNAGSRELVVRILDGTTWWNVFGHAIHEVVLEARVASGHGARWSVGDVGFVGFLDPFRSP